MTDPTSADMSDEDLNEVLAGLKQSQLDKLATELNKSKSVRNRDKEQRDYLTALGRKRMIAMEAEKIYEFNRKAPHHFDNFEDYKVYDAAVRADARTAAIAAHMERIEAVESLSDE